MEKISGTKSVFILFYLLCENFSEIGPIIKKIPNFVNDPLNIAASLIPLHSIHHHILY